MRVGVRATVLGAMLLAGRVEADVDWARGLVTGDGVGVADRHAPSPAVARGTSRRVAEDAARRAIALQLPQLPLAGGIKLSESLRDPAIKARLDRAVAAAISVAAEPETDGAWRVTMAVPIEAVRQAIAGPRELPKAGDGGPPVVVVDGSAAKPAIGALPAATVWVKDVPAWAKAAPHVTARPGKHGAIELDGFAVTPETLFVIVVGA